MRRWIVVVALVAAAQVAVAGDTPDDDDSWNDLASDGKSLVFGRFVGKFDSTQFRSRRVLLREVNTGKQEKLVIGDALGNIVEGIPPGIYDVVAFEAVYYPRISGPLQPERYRPIRQRFTVKPKTGDAPTSRILVPENRPVYIGTIRADNPFEGMVYKGHQLRVFDDFDEALARLASRHPKLVGSLELDGIVPARHFMLKPSRQPEPLDRVVGLDDPIQQARDYLADGKYRQAIAWLETFMPASDQERTAVKLLIGEALLGEGQFSDAIEELGDVLLLDANDTRALRLLARAHAYEGNLEDAQNLYEALAQILSGDAEAHLHLGYLYALQDESELASEQFRVAFETDFDYLLHDFGPFLIALREALGEESGEYLPPRVIRYNVPPPGSMQSRRGSVGDGFSVLIDHEGKVIAAQIGSQSGGSAPQAMLSLVKATYEPASLNGIPIPALFRMGDIGAPAQ